MPACLPLQEAQEAQQQLAQQAEAAAQLQRAKAAAEEAAAASQQELAAAREAAAAVGKQAAEAEKRGQTFKQQLQQVRVGPGLPLLLAYAGRCSLVQAGSCFTTTPGCGRLMGPVPAAAS